MYDWKTNLERNEIVYRNGIGSNQLNQLKWNGNNLKENNIFEHNLDHFGETLVSL